VVEEEVLDQIVMGGMPSKRISKVPYGFVYDIDYVGGLGNPSDYLEDFQVYRNASPNDIIRVHINSVGGNLATLIQLVNLMRSSQAQIITYLEGEAHSADGMLFLQGDQYIVGDHAAMLIHEPTAGFFESHNKLKKQVEFSNAHVETVFKDYYEHFLTEEEMNSVLAGQDLWLDSDQIVERLKNKPDIEEQEKI
jgi:ATP-dependent protease ClpP protease subunit